MLELPLEKKYFCSSAQIVKCKNWKELEPDIIGKCKDWKELEPADIGKCQKLL